MNKAILCLVSVVTRPYRHEYDPSLVDDARQSPYGVTVLSFEIEVTGAAFSK